MKLTESCRGVDRELSLSCPWSLGVVMELSSVIRSCHGVDWELSLSCPLSLGVVMELTGSYHGVVFCH